MTGDGVQIATIYWCNEQEPLPLKPFFLTQYGLGLLHGVRFADSSAWDAISMLIDISLGFRPIGDINDDHTRYTQVGDYDTIWGMVWGDGSGANQEVKE
jgi:hypothetical protein